MPLQGGQLTLAQSVMGSILVSMQLEQLSNWVHKELDRVSEYVFGGNSTGSQGVHLLRWETLIRTKKDGGGGANLKSAMEMN